MKKIYYDYRLITIVVIQLFLLFGVATVAMKYGPMILDSANTILDITNVLDPDDPNVYQMLDNMDSDAVIQNSELMKSYFIESIFIILLLYLLLNSLTWVLTHRILHKTSLKKMFGRFFIASSYLLLILLCIYGIYQADIALSSYIGLIIFATILLFFMYLSYARINEKNFMNLLYYFKSLKTFGKTLSLFVVWMLITSLLFYQFYYYQTIISLFVFVIIQAYFRLFFVKIQNSL